MSTLTVARDGGGRKPVAEGCGCALVTPRTRTHDSPAPPDEEPPVHIERRYDDPSSTSVMFCGLVVNLLDNGDLDPPDGNFTLPPRGVRNATCKPCLKNYALERAS